MFLTSSFTASSEMSLRYASWGSVPSGKQGLSERLHREEKQFLKRLANTALSKVHHSPISAGLWHVNLGLTQYSVELCNALVTFSSSVWRIGPLMSLFSAFLQSSGYPSPVRDLEGMHYEQDTNLLLTVACEERNLRWHHTAFDPYFVPRVTWWRTRWCAALSSPDSTI